MKSSAVTTLAYYAAIKRHMHNVIKCMFAMVAMSSLCKVHWLWVSCDMQSALVVARVTCMILCENSIEPLTVSKAVLLQHSTFGRCTFDGMDRIIG